MPDVGRRDTIELIMSIFYVSIALVYDSGLVNENDMFRLVCILFVYRHISSIYVFFGLGDNTVVYLNF